MVLSGDLSQILIMSARLTPRAFTAADAAETFAETSACIAKYMSLNPPTSEGEFKGIWQGHVSNMKPGKELHLVVRLTKTMNLTDLCPSSSAILILVDKI